MTGFPTPSPLLQTFTQSGTPNAFGTLATYVAGTATPIATYTDATLVTPNQNPLTFNATGQASVWLTLGLAYKFVWFDQFGNQLGAVDNIPGGISLANLLTLLTANVLGGILWPQNSAEKAAGVVPSNFGYPVGHILRYGPALDGSTDDTAAVQRWASVGGALAWPVAQTALISSSITLSSNTAIIAAKGATILTTVGGFSLFKATNQTGIVIDGLTFENTAAGSAFAVTFAHTQFFGCTRPIVRNCEFIGMQCGGVEFDGCTFGEINSNYLHGGLAVSGQTQSYDIALFGNTGASISNVVTNNQCYGGNPVGIFNQNEYSPFIPSKNIIKGNRVSGSLLYGIACYKPSYAAFNSYDQVVDNYVENVQGVPALLGGQGGGGIYIVGSAAGGTLVANNEVVNCCVQSTATSQSTAGISIASTHGQIYFTASVGGATSGTLGNGGSPFPNGNWNGATSANWFVTFTDGETRLVTLTNGANTCSWSGALSAGSILSANLLPTYNDPITVSGNKVSGMTQYDGIQVISNFGAGVVLSDNAINMPASNTTGFAYHIRNSSNVSASGGVLVNQGTGITLCVELEVNVTNLTLSGINVVGGGNSGSAGCVEFIGDGAHSVTGLVMNGLNVQPATGGAGLAGIYLGAGTVANGLISNCYANVATMPALAVVGCTGLRVSNNTLASSGTNAVTTTGTCTGGFLDKTNNISGGVSNAGTGFNIEQFFTAVPASGTWVLGDRAVHRGVTVGTAKAWARVTSGSGNVLGTDWISEGNL
jgi:hypothetical protein